MQKQKPQHIQKTYCGLLNTDCNWKLAVAKFVRISTNT